MGSASAVRALVGAIRLKLNEHTLQHHKVFEPVGSLCQLPYIADEARHQILESRRSRIRSIKNDAFLRFPSLGDYDDRLCPLDADSIIVDWVPARSLRCD